MTGIQKIVLVLMVIVAILALLVFGTAIDEFNKALGGAFAPTVAHAQSMPDPGVIWDSGQTEYTIFAFVSDRSDPTIANRLTRQIYHTNHDQFHMIQMETLHYNPLRCRVFVYYWPSLLPFETFDLGMDEYRDENYETVAVGCVRDNGERARLVIASGLRYKYLIEIWGLPAIPNPFGAQRRLSDFWEFPDFPKRTNPPTDGNPYPEPPQQ